MVVFADPGNPWINCFAAIHCLCCSFPKQKVDKLSRFKAEHKIRSRKPHWIKLRCSKNWFTSKSYTSTNNSRFCTRKILYDSEEKRRKNKIITDYKNLDTFCCSCSHSIYCRVVTGEVNRSWYIVVSVYPRHHWRDVWMGRIRTFRSTINGFYNSTNFLYIPPRAFWIESMSTACKYSIPLQQSRMNIIYGKKILVKGFSS